MGRRRGQPREPGTQAGDTRWPRATRATRTTHVIRAALVTCLAVALCAPVAEASVPYAGPGHEGAVPIGDDGAARTLPGGLGDNRTFVALTGFPDTTCRIVLDENGTYAQTHLDWTAGAKEARVWADAGTFEAPYRVVSHWLTDLNGACTAEVTENGVTWHDPRGRPYRDPVVNATKVFIDGHVGDTIRVPVTVTNHGTLATRVTAALSLAQEGWTISGGSPVLNVDVQPLEAQDFWFDVDVPRDQKPVTNTVVVELRDAHDWRAKVMVFLDLRPARPGDAPADTNATDDQDDLAEWTPPAQEAPAQALVPLLIALAFAVGHRRRR